MAQDPDTLFAWLGLQVHSAKAPQQAEAAVTPFPHAGLFGLPPALQLVDHQGTVPPHLQGKLLGLAPRLPDPPDQVVQCGDQRVVFGLIVGMVVAELQALQNLGTILDADQDVAAIALAGIPAAATVEGQDIVWRTRALRA